MSPILKKNLEMFYIDDLGKFLIHKKLTNALFVFLRLNYFQAKSSFDYDPVPFGVWIPGSEDNAALRPLMVKWLTQKMKEEFIK